MKTFLTKFLLIFALIGSANILAETRTFTYDANGNRTFNGIQDEFDNAVDVKKNRHYDYNDANLLSRVYSKAGGAECGLVDFLYNYRHSLEVKVVYGKQCAPAIEYIEHFFFEPSGEVFFKITRDGLGNVIKEEEFFNVEGMLLATHNETSSETTYYINNHLGNIIASVDENGDVKERANYAPYGGPLSKISNENTFLGKVLERDLEMVNLGARMHDPLTKQFLTPDTAVPLAINQVRATVRGEVDQSHLTYRDVAFLANPYSYGRNSPTTYVDKDGNVIFLAPLAIFVAKEIAAEVAIRTASHYTNGASDPILNVLSTKRLAKTIGKGALKGSKRLITKLSNSNNQSVPKHTGKVDDVAERTPEPNHIYSARELARRADAPGPNHNFPESFNSNIFKGDRTVISENYVQYSKRGTLNGRAGTYEIGVKPSATGRTEVITHRFFRPDPK